jgi:predicted MFS family arabinose efflux permease
MTLKRWVIAALPPSLLALHNAQRLAPVPLFDEFRLRLNTDYVGVGNLFGAYLFAYALFNIPAGMLADRINNKHLMAFGASLSLLASAVFAVSESYSIAIASRFTLGIAGSFLYVPTVRYIVNSFPKGKRGSTMGFVETGAGVGMFLSLTFLPLIAREFDLVKAFLTLPALAALILTGILLGLPSNRPNGAVTIRTKLTLLGSNRSFWYLITYFFLGMLANYAVFGWLPTFLRFNFGFPAVKAGFISALVTVALSVGSPLSGALSDRLGTRIPILLCGSFMAMVGFTLFLFSQEPMIVIGSALLLGASMAFTIPVLMILAGEMFGPTGAGLAVSVAATTGQIASSFSGFIFGYAFQATNSFEYVWALSLILVAGAIPFLFGAWKTMSVRAD